jgi:hypothetical protein
MLHRPGMYEVGRPFERVVRGALADLAFIDERDDELAAAFAQLRRRGQFSAYGTYGVLCAALGPGDYTEALASIYACVAAQLGYFEPARRLSDLEWARISNVESWAREKPRSRDDVIARLGPPSYQCPAQRPSVLAYAGPNDSAWLYLDLPPDADELRGIRLPTAPFATACIDLRARAEEAVAPEDVYRQFLIASLSGDEASIRPLILPREDPSLLWAGAYPEDVARLLAAQYRSVQVMRVSAPAESVSLVSEAFPEPLTLLRAGSSWLVDPEPLLRLRRERAADRK